MKQKQQLTDFYQGLELDSLQTVNEVFSGILDVFPIQLSETEALEADFTTLYKVYENNMKHFFRKIFESNNNVFYVRPHVIINTSDNYLAEKGFSSLDIEFIQKILSYKNELLQVNEHEELNKILELSTREVVLSNFFTEEIAIKGNFDLSFPLFCLSGKSKELVQRYAAEAKLYIR
ncbi:hypothetical protein D3C81_538570 [compost metagenome]|uniref:hypothetical protein n=1 Tax=Paenibacillus sp. CGMCC 1.18879 TaxID=2834466 RepID=UPI000F91214A|nr:hypothetical protein [Paenibacillus sp. CGMCC 1.18879]MBY9078997.1 hypothetical protein [Paenibacillus sp. CGMCC 1.18879]